MSTEKTSSDQHTAPVSRRKLGVAGVVGLVVAGSVVVTGIMARAKTETDLKTWTAEQAVPTVAVALPGSRPLKPTLDLPGRLEAYSRAPIFGRVSGYLKSWDADMGAHVKAGQVIAEIDAPDLDQQLLQARADLVSQQSSAKLSEATLNRRKTLVASNFVSAQEIDERTADLNNKRAAVKSGEANVQRLEALADYKKITVPFDGIVTQRNTDVGALISGGTGTGAAMFVISDVSKLRVYVEVPQNFAPAVQIGTKATITVPDHPNEVFEATVEASSRSVDIGSGTTRMQLRLDNADGKLMPGGFANVKLALTGKAAPLHIPASALILGAQGLRVATVTPDDKIAFKTVTIARDLGREIEIGSGLVADDRVVTAPPDGLVEGDKVRVTGGPAAKNGKPTAETEKKEVKG